MAKLIMFHGKECGPCNAMMPLVEKLEKELKLKVQKREVWHDEKNAKELQKLDDGSCGGVPFFYNETTKKVLCGKQTYAVLKDWAK